ncbi:MAG: cupin domain-containing protein [Bacteroidales bacterium]|nr:cupin domain-containing protein [Bacteroidales bacterium]
MIRKSVPKQAPQVSAAVDGRTMHSDSRAEAILLTLQPGEEMPMHKNPFDVLFAGIKGEALLVCTDQTMTIIPGETIFVTADEDRAWQNKGQVKAQILVFKILS